MLTSKQRAYLRKLAQAENAIFQVGKLGINENLIEQLKDALEKNELIKISLLDTMLDNTDDDKNEIATTIASLTSSEVVSVMGKKITLYKKSTKKPKIELPKQESTKK